MKVEQCQLSRGQIIRKKSYNVFGRGEGLTMVVRKIKPSSNPDMVYVNGVLMDPNNVVIITQEEADSIQAEFDSLRISPADRAKERSACTRRDNGERKEMLSTEKAALLVLWQMRKKYPEKKFEAYECPHCTFLHVGKAVERVSRWSRFLKWLGIRK